MKYILMVVDFASQYLKAVPLRNTDTSTVANVLINIMCRMGFATQLEQALHLV